MRKTRMISVIAASLLTATVVFTGCGGGGSSTTVASSSSSSSSVSSSSTSSSTSSACLPGQTCGSSSSVAPTIKTVTVSDGWVLGATVKCKNSDGSDVATGVAASSVGTYEIDITGKSCPVLCAKEGYIDVNGDGKITSGEPKAPEMGAPGEFTHITPYSTLLANGVSIADLEAATGLSAAEYNNFDMAVPVSKSLEYAKQAVLLSAAIAYIQTNNAMSEAGDEEYIASSSSTSTETSVTSSTSSSEGVLPTGPGPRGVLPSGPGETTTTVSSTTSSVASSVNETDGGVLPSGPGAGDTATTSSTSSNTTPMTYATLIERMKNGETIDQIIPQLATLVSELNSVSADDYAQDPAVFDKKAATLLVGIAGKCAEDICVETTENMTSSEQNLSSSVSSEADNMSSEISETVSSSTSSCVMIPGRPCTTSSSTEVSSSSTEYTSSTSSEVSTSDSSSSSVSSSVSTSVTGTVLPSGPGA